MIMKYANTGKHPLNELKSLTSQQKLKALQRVVFIARRLFWFALYFLNVSSEQTHSAFIEMK